MNDFWFLTTSNAPRLRDPTSVLRIIDRYVSDLDLAVTVTELAGGEHCLGIGGDCWPSAWPVPPGVRAQDLVPDYTNNGLDDFASFLADLGPFLMEPLVVQSIGTVVGRFPLSACEWRVEPGTRAVTKLEFTSSADTPDTVLSDLLPAW